MKKTANKWRKKFKAQGGRNIPKPGAGLTDIEAHPEAGDPSTFELQNAHPLQKMTGGWPDFLNQHKINWGHVALDAAFAVDSLIPPKPIKKPVVQPQESYTQYPYGTGSQAIYKYGGDISMTGYKRNSPDKYKPSLTIPTGDISMKGVDYPVYGQDNTGYSQMMYPEQDYKFPGDSVVEYPMGLNGTIVFPSKKQILGKAKGGKKILPMGMEELQFGGIVPGLTGTMYARNSYKPREHVTNSQYVPYGEYSMEDGGELEEAKGGWISKAATSIKRRGTKGKCTPVTKSGCSGKAKALALTFKKIARNRKHEDGGKLPIHYQEGETYHLDDNQIQHLISQGYNLQVV